MMEEELKERVSKLLEETASELHKISESAKAKAYTHDYSHTYIDDDMVELWHKTKCIADILESACNRGSGW